jgi:hypothetical protein
MTRPLPLEDFLVEVEKTRAHDVLPAVRSAAAVPAAVTLETAERVLDEARDYVLSLYRPVVGKVAGTFDDHGLAVDCIPIDAQPGLEATGARAPAAPPPFKEVRGVHAPRSAMRAPLREDRRDRFGNPQFAPPGTIPMVRVTPERIAGAGGMQRFFEKAPGGGRHPLRGAAERRVQTRDAQQLPMQTVGNAIHAYAHAFQRVTNYGGQSWLNVWTPDPAPGVFALSQQWFTGGQGNGLQTVESGWHVYPQLYNESQNVPRLFLFFTADGYQSTGSYNLTRRPGQGGFVQTDGSWVVGGSLPASDDGGDQQGFLMQWQMDSAGWWLYLQGDGDPVAVGYYPMQLFGRGQLTQAAEMVDFGGEVCGVVGGRQTGEMGSGQPASAGWQRAAFQKLICHSDGQQMTPADLTVDDRDNRCYSLEYHDNDAEWGTYFFFGGPGGCQW